MTLAKDTERFSDRPGPRYGPEKHPAVLGTIRFVLLTETLAFSNQVSLESLGAISTLWRPQQTAPETYQVLFDERARRDGPARVAYICDCHGLVDVSVLADDQRRLPAQLEPGRDHDSQ